ncbi:MAG: glycosyltransferase [Myxococcales bacterium]|nr:glycosyltransferase [Myxococcales bacterium]
MGARGVVVIGRNEGERLVKSLESVVGRVDHVVYVDSGSEDGSVAAAKARGAEVVDLDMSIPFTAARARNAGWRRLREIAPDTTEALFIDGDCEVLPGFLESAHDVLSRDAGVVAVCGYRRERHPERSIYNRVCDVEWRSGPVGDCKAFGGDVVIRLDALEAVGGYDESVIAAEDDELGIRLRAAGGRIHRVDVESTLHDAAMTSIDQWWKRSVRCGYAYAQVHDMHGRTTPDHYFESEKRRSLVWGAAVPAAAVGLAPVTAGASLGLLGLFGVQVLRIARGAERRGLEREDAWAWGLSCAFSKIPEAYGIAKYHLDKAQKKRPEIIEYKGAETP